MEPRITSYRATVAAVALVAALASACVNRTEGPVKSITPTTSGADARNGETATIPAVSATAQPVVRMGPTVVVESSTHVVTGEPVDPLIAAIESRDVNRVLNNVGRYFAAQGCDGNELRSQEVKGIDRAEIRAWVQMAFDRGDGSSVYAIAVGPVARGGGNEFQIWVSASREPWPTTPATFWLADEQGRLMRLEFVCLLGAGVATGGGATGYLVAPRAYCIDGPAETFLEVEEKFVDPPTGAVLIGKELLRDGTPTGDRVEATFPFRDLGTNLLYPTASPNGTPVVPVYLGAGSRLRLEGFRLRSCVVQATSIAAMK